MKYLQSFWQQTLCLLSKLYVFGQPGIFQLTSLIHIIPDGFLDASPMEKLLPGLTPENFWKFYIFLASQAAPDGVLRQGVISLLVS